jgi:hypothetical protein
MAGSMIIETGSAVLLLLLLLLLLLAWLVPERSLASVDDGELTGSAGCWERRHMACLKELDRLWQVFTIQR